MSRDHDLVIFGATGDAGRAMVALLAESAPHSLRWTIAGRSASKLESLAPVACGKVLVADCADDAALRMLAARTRVIISAAGPFSVLGERVMLACIEAKTHYVDITGEVPWVAAMRRRHGTRAITAGVCIASFCGYDCVPCELGLYLGRQALGAPLSYAESVLLLEPSSDGGAPRGTLLTTLALMHDVPAFLRGLLGYVPPGQRLPLLASLLSCMLPRWSSLVHGFTLPHFMFWCNTPVVHASAACVGRPPPPVSVRLCRSAAAAAAATSTAAAATSTAAAPPTALTTPTTLRFRDAMLLPYCDRWFTLWGLLPLLAYASLLLFAPLAWLLLAAPPLKRAAQRSLLGSYSYAGAKTARTVFRTRVVAAAATPLPAYVRNTGAAYVRGASRGGARTARVDMVLPGDGGIFATALLATSCARAMLDVLDGREESFTGERCRLPAGLCSPVEALGGALVAQLRAAPGVLLEVNVAPEAASKEK